MTEETRRSAPSDFRPADRGVDYIENECAEGKILFFYFLIGSGKNLSIKYFLPNVIVFVSKNEKQSVFFLNSKKSKLIY